MYANNELENQLLENSYDEQENDEIQLNENSLDEIQSNNKIKICLLYFYNKIFFSLLLLIIIIVTICGLLLLFFGCFIFTNMKICNLSSIFYIIGIIIIFIFGCCLQYKIRTK